MIPAVSNCLYFAGKNKTKQRTTPQEIRQLNRVLALIRYYISYMIIFGVNFEKTPHIASTIVITRLCFLSEIKSTRNNRS